MYVHGYSRETLVRVLYGCIGLRVWGLGLGCGV